MAPRLPGTVFTASRAEHDVITPLVTSFSGTAYTPVLSDANGFKRSLSASAATVTVAQDSTTFFPLGTVLTYEQEGAGQVTFVAGTNVTLVSAGSKVATAAQNAVVSLIKKSANTWTLFGNLA